MDVLYHREPYFPRECALLLARGLADPESTILYDEVVHVDAFLRHFGQSHPVQIGAVRERLAPFCAVAEYVLGHIKTPMERLRFYFAPPAGCKLVPGLLFAHLERQGIEVAHLTGEDRHRTAATLFRGTFLGDDATDFPPDEGGLYDWLERQGLSAEDKWTATLLYHRMEEYQVECRAILREAEVLYRAQSAIWEPVLREGMAVTRENLERSGAAYLTEHYHVHLDFAKLEVFPSLAGFNSLSFCNFSDENPLLDADLMDMGYLVDELMSTDHHSAETIERLGGQLKAISDRKRLEILTALRLGPLCGQELAERVGLTPATVSHHMNELVSNGFVNIVKEGTRANYLYSPAGMELFFSALRRQFRVDEP